MHPLIMSCCALSHTFARVQDKIAAMIGDLSFKIKPRLGDYVLLNRNQVCICVMFCTTSRWKALTLCLFSFYVRVTGPPV
jgi:hypothetical protein